MGTAMRLWSAFYDYLKGPEASAIFKRYGFTTPLMFLERTRMAGGAAEPESLLPGGGLEPALWHLFSWLLVRRTFPGKALLDSILHLPLVLPPVVVGYLLLVAMGRRGFIGSWLYDWFGISFALAGAGRCWRRR